MLDVLLETEARRPRRGAGMAVALVVHLGLAMLALRPRTQPAVALPRPDEVTLRAPVVPRSSAPAPARGARAAAAATSAPAHVAVPVVVPVTVAVGLPPVELARPAGEALAIASGSVAGTPGGTGAAGAGLPAGDAPFEVADVERPAVPLAGNPVPAYPEPLRRAGLDGTVVVQFIVDTLGRVEPGSMQVVQATHPSLADAVAAVLPRWRFAPAESAGRRVRMLVRQPVAFGLAR